LWVARQNFLSALLRDANITIEESPRNAKTLNGDQIQRFLVSPSKQSLSIVRNARFLDDPPLDGRPRFAGQSRLSTP